VSQRAPIVPGADAPATASRLPGPFPVGTYSARLRAQLRGFTRVQLTGEVFGVSRSRVRIYFELRDAQGAIQCSMWRDDFEALGVPLADGLEVVVGGGCDYYVGNSTSSPSFHFAVSELRIAGEGDLLAELERRRRRLLADGLFEPQKRLARPSLPRTIGVVCGEHSKARDDVLAGLRRRGWQGRLVWAFAPVQDRRAAPAIAAALRELSACGEVEVVIVARGGGSLADLYAFCDEALCRTVALLRVPVISSVGHHADRTLIDDVSAVCCSTPTHAAEAAVPIDCNAARAQMTSAAQRLQVHSRRAMHQRAQMTSAAQRLQVHSRRAILQRAQTLQRLAGAPAHHIARQRRQLHQLLRELRATARRSVEKGHSLAGVHLLVLGRTVERAGGSERAGRERDLQRLALALAAHDPERTLARGYALVEDHDGEALGSAVAARAAGELRLRFHDGRVPATVTSEVEP
jgi:exodeoxyribonuclease VII large subunit